MKLTEFIEYYKDNCHPMAVMMKMSPGDKLDWKPNPNSWTLGQLLFHCAETPDAILALINNTWPSMEEMEKSMKESLTLSKMKGEEAVKTFESCKEKTIALLEKLSEEDFQNKPASTPWGSKGSLGRLLQEMVDHQNNHKCQLYMYLKQLGLPVNTMTLYAGQSG